MIFKHTRPTDRLSLDAAFVAHYFAEPKDDGGSPCERSAKFETGNFALHFVESNTTLAGAKNLSYWYSRVRGQPSRLAASAAGGGSASLLSSYDAFLDDATVFYVSDLTDHTLALLSADAAYGVQLLAREYAVPSDDDADDESSSSSEDTWYTLTITMPSGKAMQILSTSISPLAYAQLSFSAWQAGEALESQFAAFSSPSTLKHKYNVGGYGTRANGQ